MTHTHDSLAALVFSSNFKHCFANSVEAGGEASGEAHRKQRGGLARQWCDL